MRTRSSLNADNRLQNEISLLGENIRRVANRILDGVFDLRPRSAILRGRYLLVFLIASGFIISLRYYPLELWTRHIQDIFLYSLNPAYRASYPGNPVSAFISFGLTAYFDPRTLQYLPIFLASFFIALECAAVYLADIFENDNVGVARSFVREVALWGNNKSLRIKAGYIADEDIESPIHLIGGPGKVEVDIDSVALFERSDGTPHIIGPTGDKPGGKETLDGFERFRAAINLRDHFATLRDQDDKSRSISSRSLDGIRVSALDVQIISSIHRGNQKPTDKNQFPFNSAAVRMLVYESASRVTPESSQPSTYAFIWENIPPSLVRGELGKFMSGKKLSEYLASFGILEVDKAQERESAIVAEARQVIPASESAPSLKIIDPPPPFTPRTTLSNLFNEFETTFRKTAEKRGVEFRWTGVGTWKTIDIVPEHHIEAWKLTNENAHRGDKKFIEGKGAEAGLAKVIGMIQDVPLAYQSLTESSPDRDTAIRSFLEEYRRQLKDMFEFLVKTGRRIPPTLVAALAYLFQIFTRSRLVQRTQTEPATARERQLLEELQRKIGDCNGIPLTNVVEQLIEFERRFSPTDSLEQLLEKINRDWDQDMTEEWSP